MNTSTKIKAIILDDDSLCTENLQYRLNLYHPEVEILKVCNDPLEAVDYIQNLKPNVVFLDIQMPVLNGMQLLEQYFPRPDFQVIFTTAYEEYALKAIQLNALHYLIKPIAEADLNEAIKRVSDRIELGLSSADAIQDMLSQREIKPSSIRLKNNSGHEIRFNLKDIIRFKSENGYARIYFVKMGGFADSFINSQIGNLETMLTESDFFQVNRTYLINLKFITGYHHSKGEIVMLDDFKVEVSRRRKQEFENIWGKMDFEAPD